MKTGLDPVTEHSQGLSVESEALSAPPASTELTMPEEHNPRLTLPWKIAVAILATMGIVLAINQVFFLNLFGISVPTNSFLYLVMSCFLPIVFIVYPLKTKKNSFDTSAEENADTIGQGFGVDPRVPLEEPEIDSTRTGVPWYDVILGVTILVVPVYFAYNGTNISDFGWSLISPTAATALSFVLWVLVLEVLRRTAGWIVTALAAVISLYPLIAGVVPITVLQGIEYDLVALARLHVMGSDSILGLPLQTAANILIGFLLFGTTLQHTGGAAFFNDLANSVFGQFRGGAAKVSVASSASMGMMSGSAVSNVLTTGPMSIPTMIKSGFSRVTAGAVEATASSGGSITPPIMGTAAFLMVSFVGVPYTEILIAAAIPAFLYYFGIFMQIDGYSAVRNLHGEDRRLLPRFVPTAVQGWAYLLALGLLTALLLMGQSEAQIPFWVVGFLILVALASPKVDFTVRSVGTLLVDAGRTIAQIIGIIAGVGLILGGLSATGVALSLSRDLVVLVGDNVLLILLAGALACFILGMGLTISAAYVFLAIVMVPALTAMDVNPIAAHLFVIYWASVSYITPPVGLAAFAAASISKASPMATCFEAMKFGAVKYVVPFAFVFNPALVAQADGANIAVAFVASVVAVFALSAMFSGYLQIVEVRLNWATRVILGAGGVMVMLPAVMVSGIGLAFIVLGVILAAVFKKSGKTNNQATVI